MEQKNFNRKYYIDIAKNKGIEAALTELHLDYERWEFDSFEGAEGYQNEKWQNLERFRELGRDLWNYAGHTAR